MKIAVNTRLLLKNKMEGIGWFAFETLQRITRQHPEHQFYFIFDRPYDQSFIFADNITPVVIGPQSRHPVLWYIWFNWSLAAVLRKIKPDVFFSPEGYICPNTKVKTINTMHDIAYEHYPETVPRLVKKYYRHFFPIFARRADKIATVSEFSRQDLISHYHIQGDKIKVVYAGCNESYHPISEAAQAQARQKFTKGKPFFVYIGAINPRKNIINLLKAFELFKETDTSGAKIVLIGKKGFGSEEVDTVLQTLKCKEDVIFTGRVEEAEDVNNIIASAIAITYVSVFEGFGIPCLEAMRCGTAVITSNTSSMPEVCGEAAIYVDPLSVGSISQAMQKIAGDEALRNELIHKGAVQALKFSWQKTADALWEMIETA